MSTKETLKKQAAMFALNGKLRSRSMMKLFGWARSTLTYHEGNFTIWQPGGEGCQKFFTLESVLDYIDNQCREE